MRSHSFLPWPLLALVACEGIPIQEQDSSHPEENSSDTGYVQGTDEAKAFCATFDLPDQSRVPLVINEFQPWNKSTLENERGDSADWLELYNPTRNDVDLLCWSMADIQGDNSRRIFSRSLIVPAGGWLLLFADGDSSLEGHVHFELNKEGDAIFLYEPSGTLTDSKEYDAANRDSSYGRFPDGSVRSGAWQEDRSPSPGAANGGEP